MTDEKRCGTCQWFSDQQFGYGSCEFPLPEWVVVTLRNIHYNTFPAELLPPGSLWETEGKDCPTWQAK